MTLFELDLPGVFAFKHDVLHAMSAAARCDLRSVPVDLRHEWSEPLIAAGFDTRHPAAWLIEGLLIYLSADEAVRLFTTVGQLCAPAREVAFEYESLGTDPMRAHAADSPVMASYAALWKGGLPDPKGWLAAHGWHVEQHDRAAMSARYGRLSPGGSAGGFMTATRAG